MRLPKEIQLKGLLIGTVSLICLVSAICIAFYGLNLELNIISLAAILSAAYALVFVVLWLLFLQPYKELLVGHERLNEARKESERLALFPINTPNPLVQVDFEGRIMFINTAAEQQFPDLLEQAGNHSVLQGLEDFIKDLRHSQQRRQYENIVMNREVIFHGKIYNQNIISVDVSGRPALIIYFYDITAIKRAEEKIRLFEAVVVNAKDGVVITDANLEKPGPFVLYANEAFSKICDYDVQEVIGKSPRFLQGKNTDKAVLSEMKQALLRGRPFRGEIKNYRRDGKDYWLDITIFPVKDENGRITNFAAIERDVTARKDFEAELMNAKEAAEVANQAKDDFLANISHELRTPMNGILGLTDLLVDMNLNPEQFELAQAVQGSSRNLLILLNDILDLSKIEAKQLTLENIPYDIRRVVRQTTGLLQATAVRKNIVLEAFINPAVPEVIIGDPARLQQILNNLISNAIKFTEIGYVKLDVNSQLDAQKRRRMQIRVEDTGIGLPQEKHADVFNKFTQADVSTSRKYGGTGLGLAITKELVEIMEGTITLQSIPGKGTTFTIDIPIIVKEGAVAELAKPRVTQNIPRINKNSSILVVDDHNINLLVVSKFLKKLGITNIDQATNGKDAIKLYSKRNYDLILMDCQMPDIDGFQTASYIRKIETIQNKTKIIAVTADAMKGAREKCLQAGMNDYISKPVEFENLQAVLAVWIPLMAQTGSSVFPQPKKEEIRDIPQVMDWNRLKMFTDGDAVEEAELIGIFTEYAKEVLEHLAQSCTPDKVEIWRKAAHKLRGSAANLGAGNLAQICEVAENASVENITIKQEILSRIESAYKQVAAVLEARITANSLI